MGIIKIGNKEYVGRCLIIEDNKIILDRLPIYEESKDILQINCSDSRVERIFVDGNVLVEGDVGRCEVGRYLSIVGYIVKYFVKDRRCFFNNTAKEDFRKTKKFLQSKVEGKSRSIIRCRESFSDIIMHNNRNAIDHELIVKGNVSWIKAGGDVSVKGVVDYAKVEEGMYVSKG